MNLAVDRAALEKLGVCSLSDELAVIKHEDPIRRRKRCGSLRNDQNRHLPRKLRECRPKPCIGGIIKGA